MFDLLENGFLMIKEDESYSSPIATIFYEYYENETDLKIKLHQDKGENSMYCCQRFYRK